MGRFAQIAKHFNPAWFAAVMGTAVIPLVLSFLNFPGRTFLASFFFIAAIALFLIALVPWTARFFLFPADVRRDLRHPVAAHFFPTMPIALVILALDLLKYPDLFLSAETSRALAFWLWLAGSLGIHIFALPILIRVFSHKEITPAHANFGWFIPPVSKMIIPVAGLELTELYPQALELTFGLSLVSFGIGFFLFLFVGAAVYHRYIYHELPMSRLAPTFFIGMVPTAIMAAIFFKMIHLFENQVVLGIDPQIFTPLAKIAILMCWGFSAWWFVVACIMIAYYLRYVELPYALSWWAFTFPSGALCLASAAAWQVSGFVSIYAFLLLATCFLLAVWLIVLIRTIRGIVSGKLFLPVH